MPFDIRFPILDSRLFDWLRNRKRKPKKYYCAVCNKKIEPAEAIFVTDKGKETIYCVECLLSEKDKNLPDI